MAEPAMKMETEKAGETADIEDTIMDLISDARGRSPEHERVFGCVYDIYISNVLNRYDGDQKIDALKGIVKAVDATSKRTGNVPSRRTNTIEIDMAADIGVKYSGKIDCFCEELAYTELGIDNAGIFANAYWVLDCLPPQFERMRKHGNPFGPSYEWSSMELPRR